MKGFHISKRIWVILTVTLLSGIFFYFYFFEYVAGREKDLIAVKYRRLARAGINIGLAENGLKKNFELIAADKMRGIIESSNPEEKIDEFNEYMADNYQADVNFWDDETFIHRSKKYLDSVFVKTKIEDLKLDATEDLDLRGKVAMKGNSISFAMPMSFFLSFNDIDLKKDFDEALIVRIVKPAIKKDQAVVENNSTVTVNCQSCERQESNSPVARIAFQTFKNKVELKQLDSLLDIESGLYTSRYSTVSINSVNYLIFPHRIKWDNGEEDWLICGLVKEKEFNKKARQVELFTIILAALLVVFTLLAMPIIKLVVMSAYERLQIINVWFVGFSIVVGTAIIVIILLLLHHEITGRPEVDSRLENLANHIEGNFKKEIRSAYNQLKEHQYVRLARMIGKDSLSPKMAQNFYSLFDEIIWIDIEGRIIDIKANHPNGNYGDALNLRDRDYFRDAFKYPIANRPDLHDSLWMLPDSKPSEQSRFALQSIRSWSDGELQAGITVPINQFSPNGSPPMMADTEPKVLALATHLYSVMDVVMPPGYGFCIVDDSGNVWFHSDTHRNLRENFFEEINCDALVSAVRGRNSVPVSITYDDEASRAFVKPIDNIPLTVIVYHDMRFYFTPVDMTVSYAVSLMAIMFAIGAIHFFLLYVCSYFGTRLKIKRFFLSWLRPQSDHDVTAIDGIEVIQASRKYRKSMVFQAILVVITVTMIIISNERWVALCLILLPVYLLTFHYLLLRRERIFLSIDAQKKTENEGSRSLIHFLTNSASVFTFLSLLMVFVIHIIAIPVVENIWPAVITQIFWIACGILCYYVEGIRFSFSITSPYHTMLGLWLTLISILGPIYFYKVAFREETRIWTRYVQLEAAKGFFGRKKQLESKSFYYSRSEEQKLLVDSLGFYMKDVNEINCFSLNKKIDDVAIPEQNSLKHDYEAIIFSLAPSVGGLVEKARQTIFHEASDEKWWWTDVDEESEGCTGKYFQAGVDMEFINDEGDTYKVSSLLPIYRPFSGQYVWITIIIFVSALLLFYRVIRFCVRNIFGLEMNDLKLFPDALDETSLAAARVNKLFVVGLPYSGKTKMVESHFKPTTWINLQDSRYFVGSEERIVLNHFEYGINDHKINNKKLELLHEITKKGSSKIIILSTIQPTVIIDFYDRLIKAAQESKLPESKNECMEYKQSLRYWKNVLSGFSLTYVPLEKSDLVVSTNSVNAKLFLNSELGHGNYLPTVISHLPLASHYDRSLKETTVLQIEEISEPYYYSLWNSFSSAEKFLLYDLAKDRFVNFRNSAVIRALIQKGVLVMDDNLQIMNRSFNNFILSVVKEDEEIKMEMDLHSKGTWNVVQLGLILIMLALVSFIALGREGILTSLNAWVTAITGVVALLARFSGIFTGKAKE